MPNHTGEPCSYKTMYVCHTMCIYLAWFRGNRYNTCYYEYRVSPYSRYIIRNMYWMYHSLIWHMLIEIRFQIWIFQYYMNLFTHIWQPLMYNNIDTRHNPAVYSLLASIHWSHYVQYSGKSHAVHAWFPEYHTIRRKTEMLSYIIKLNYEIYPTCNFTVTLFVWSLYQHVHISFTVSYLFTWVIIIISIMYKFR